MRAKTLALASGVLLVASVFVFALSSYLAGRAGGEAVPPGDIVTSVGLVESPSDQESASLAGDLVAMVARWTDPLIGKPGWIHVREEVLQDHLELGSLPDGSPIPSDYVFESWYLLDDGGFVVAGVSRMTDSNGEEIQTSVYENSAWTNLTFGFTSVEGPFKPNLDHGLTLDLTSPGRITSFDEREILADGAPAREVATFESFSAPSKFEGFPGAITRITKRAVFDRESGALKTYETVLRSEGGEELRVSLVTVLASERISAPPASVLDLFKEVPQ